ncbi:MAG: methylmalonyl-CoA carboxyltransferase [Alphaproteobacteria bacterium]|nr:methylmalonyl-CoA carboxyltransferase [Alphaproteobacteria bacterium]
MAYEKQLEELSARRTRAKAMGSPKRLAERKEAGVLNARERVALLTDAGSFEEVGLLAASVRPEVRERTPADGVVSGFGKIGGRLVGVNAADFTTFGSSSAETHGKKQGYVRNACQKSGLPLIYMQECAGGRIPDIMGATGIGRAGEGGRVTRRRTNPHIAACLGLTYGGGAFACINSDLVVMKKGAVLAVSSQMTTSVAIGEEADPQELGGWRLHSEVTGFVDAVVDTDAEAVAWVKRALSYFPDHANAVTPLAPVPDGADAAQETLLELVPESRAKTYDIRKAIAAICDPGSVLPVKDRFAKVATTCLARLNGRAIGVIASNPMFKGGALDPDSCDKIASFIILCDSFNLPIVFVADTPGFLVGLESERRRLPGKIMNFMSALEQSTVPKVALVLRKSFGQAYINMGAGRSDATAAWAGAEISFMDPAVAVNIVYAVKREDDPERFAELAKQVSKETSAYDLAAPFMAQAVIDPRETRAYLTRQLEIFERRPTGGIGEHRLADWPPAF